MHKRRVPNEHQLIFLCTRLEINDSIRQEIKKLLNSPIDWNKIIETSNRHEILPFLYYSMKKLELQDIIPQDIFAEMKNYYYANLKKNLKVEKEIFHILELTKYHGLNIIPLKGFSLIQTLYHNPALRIMVDVDILIKKNELQKIKDILNQLGYYQGKEASQKHYQKYQYEIAFSKTTSSNQYVIIEIHCLLAWPRPYKINLPCLWQRTQEKTINSQKLVFLSGEDTFLSLALHLRRHTRRLTLKFVVDIAELLNTKGDKLDWLYITESARNNHIKTSVYFSLYIAKELLGAAVSPKTLNGFCPNTIKSALIHFTINKYNFFVLKKWQGYLLRFLLFDRTIDFFLYLWRVSFLERIYCKGDFRKILTARIIKKNANINAGESTKK